MKTVKLLKNTIQNYAWGSPIAIPELLGIANPAGEPRAELWMGAHPKAPSLVYCDSRWVSLKDLIDRHPREILGQTVALNFNNRLPYLFKVLAAAKPLSIQAHPSRAQAREGYQRENRLGIDISAADRNYKDDNHKPECICALSPFQALCGFRNCFDILDLTEKYCPRTLAGERALLKKESNSQGLKQFFSTLMTMDTQRQKQVIDEALVNAKPLSAKNPVALWMTRLAAAYPFDIGLLAPMLLNLVELKPGEALFLPAGELHAYLEGLGIELMANSDNVLRGGLTDKHVDVAELMKVLNFKSLSIDISPGIEKNETERVYPCDAVEFVLSMISVAEGHPFRSAGRGGVEIMLCTDGAAALQQQPGNEIVKIAKGDSVIIPAAVDGYMISGRGVLYRAAVP